MADDEFDDLISEVEADADAIEIDLSEETVIKPVPAGRYLTRVLSVAGAEDPKVKPGMLKIQYGFADPDFPEYAKKKSWRTYQLKGGGVSFLTEALEHFGQEVDRSTGKFKLSRSKLIGAEAVCTWAVSEYNPKYNDVEAK